MINQVAQIAEEAPTTFLVLAEFGCLDEKTR